MSLLGGMRIHIIYTHITYVYELCKIHWNTHWKEMGKKINWFAQRMLRFWKTRVRSLVRRMYMLPWKSMSSFFIFVYFSVSTIKHRFLLFTYLQTSQYFFFSVVLDWDKGIHSAVTPECWHHFLRACCEWQIIGVLSALAAWNRRHIAADPATKHSMSI